MTDERCALLTERAEYVGEIYALRERVSSLERRVLCLEVENHSKQITIDRLEREAGMGIPHL